MSYSCPPVSRRPGGDCGLCVQLTISSHQSSRRRHRPSTGSPHARHVRHADDRLIVPAHDRRGHRPECNARSASVNSSNVIDRIAHLLAHSGNRASCAHPRRHSPNPVNPSRTRTYVRHTSVCVCAAMLRDESNARLPQRRRTRLPRTHVGLPKVSTYSFVARRVNDLHGLTPLLVHATTGLLLPFTNLPFEAAS